MGRKRGKQDPSRVYTFSLKPNDLNEILLKKKNQKIEADSLKLIQMLDEIADRERVSRSELIKQAIAAYIGLHYEGNFQTLMDGYSEGGPVDDNIILGRVRQRMLELSESRTLTRKMILEALKEEGIEKKRPKFADSTIQWLRENGKKVSY